MAVNKVVYGSNTLIDLTNTTASAEDVAQGKYFYTASGVRTNGTLTFVTYYTGSTDPSSSLGSDGDIYLKVAN